MGGAAFYGLTLVWRELILFASVGFLIGGIDELAVDVIWLGRSVWRRLFVYSHHQRSTAETLAAPKNPGLIVVFIAAWDEGDIIGLMLRYTLAVLSHDNYRIYVGCYPNDSKTLAAARGIDSPNLRVIVGRKPGPTTKADCLNTLYCALQNDEHFDGVRAKAIVLHDAEDVVHPHELRVFDTLIERFDLVQLPVFPLFNPHSPWVAGHYCDEFAEAHGKTLVVREALGAAIPAAGVGCAFARETLAQIATAKGGQPFDAESLTEDYELGLMIGAMGGKTVLARLPSGRATVQVNAHFPATLDAAVKQKARWITGIALAGYDRLGWSGGIAETWMRLRDRRAIAAAMLLSIGYLTILITAVFAIFHFAWKAPMPSLSPMETWLVEVNALLLMGRLVVRAYFVGRLYGWAQAAMSAPRLVTANVIAMMAARRALVRYLKMRRTGIAEWEKTSHVFPTGLPQ